MDKKKIVKFFFICVIAIILIVSTYFKIFEKKPTEIDNSTNLDQEQIYSSNIITDVNYTTKDANGNEYIITAQKGEIDFSNSSIIYVTNVTALMKLKGSGKITITSDHGKYNIDNFDTIFSKNVLIDYLDYKISGEYLDFSINNDTMTISRNVILTSSENVLRADVIEMNISSKDTKIFMYEKEKKINIRNKN